MCEPQKRFGFTLRELGSSHRPRASAGRAVHTWQTHGHEGLCAEPCLDTLPPASAFVPVLQSRPALPALVSPSQCIYRVLVCYGEQHTEGVPVPGLKNSQHLGVWTGTRLSL